LPASGSSSTTRMQYGLSTKEPEDEEQA
jgi:hypothetical protein